MEKPSSSALQCPTLAPQRPNWRDHSKSGAERRRDLRTFKLHVEFLAQMQCHFASPKEGLSGDPGGASKAGGAARHPAAAFSSAATPSILPVPTTDDLLMATAFPCRVTTTLPMFHRRRIEPECRSTWSASRRSTQVTAGVSFHPCGTVATSAGLSASSRPVAP